MKNSLNIILSFFLLTQSFVTYAENIETKYKQEVKPQCVAADAGAKAGGGTGVLVGSMTGAALFTKIAATGCAVSAMWTFGLGCVVSVATGAFVGGMVGSTVGQDIGEATCDEQ
jgi:hypothetical protein